MRRSLLATASAGCALVLAGVLAAPAAAATELSHEASLTDGGYAEIVLTSGPDLAGEWLSVLVMDEDATFDQPAAADIVYIDQRVLDADGAVEVRVKLPTAELDGYWLAANTTGGTERYLAPLDGETDEVPTDGPTDEPTAGPTDGPTDGPTPGPTDGPTDGPTAGPTDDPSDGPTGGPTDGPGDGGPGDGGPGDGGPGAGGPGDDDAGAGGPGDDDAGAGGPGDDGAVGADGSTGGSGLSRTGAPVMIAVGVALAAVLAGGAALYLRRRA